MLRGVSPVIQVGKIKGLVNSLDAGEIRPCRHVNKRCHMETGVDLLHPSRFDQWTRSESLGTKSHLTSC